MRKSRVSEHNRIPFFFVVLAYIVLQLVFVLCPTSAEATSDTSRYFRDDQIRDSATISRSESATAGILRLVDRLGGATRTVALQGELVYLAEGSQLTILDIANPAAPAVVGKSPNLPGIVTDIETTPTLVYVLAGGDLYILALSEPASPWIHGFYDLAGAGMDLQVIASEAYVATGDAGLRILDVSEPSAVSEIGHFDGDVVSVAVDGDHAYIAADGMRILNISDPAMPEEVGELQACKGYGFYSVIDIALYGNIALVLGEYQTDFYPVPTLCAVRVTEPASPTAVSFQFLYASSVGVRGNISLAGNLAFIHSGQLLVFDITDPNWPVQLATYDTSGEVASDSIYAYVADAGDGMHVFDIRVPEAPIEIAHYGPTLVPWIVTMQGEYVYVVSRNALTVAQITSTTMKSVAVLDWAGIHAVAADDDYAALSLGRAGMSVVDISDPSNPLEVGRFTGTGTNRVSCLTLAGGYAYLATDHSEGGNSGLYILDMSDPSQPAAMSFLDLPGDPSDLTVDSDLAYLSSRWGAAGLRIFDVSNQYEPSELSHVDTPGYAWTVTLADDLAFVAESKGLTIVDVADPVAPVTISHVVVQGGLRDVAVHKDRVYLAAGETGVYVYDITDPFYPVQMGYYDTPGSAIDVAIDGNDVLVADVDGGLLRLRYLTFRSNVPLTMRD